MHIDLIRVGHRFNESKPWLFRGLSTRLYGGTATAVIGPSGTGKSTLLAILGQMLPPAEGEVVSDRNLSVARVSQASHGVPNRIVIDHICLPFLARGLRRQEAEKNAAIIADDFGLGALVDQPFRQLSGGEAQRLMLARAVAMDADVILADEPTASLDAANAAGVIKVLGRLAGQGAAVVVATHDQRATKGCDAVIDLSEYAQAQS